MFKNILFTNNENIKLQWYPQQPQHFIFPGSVWAQGSSNSGGL